MSNREKYDWSMFTDKKETIDLYGKAFRRAMQEDAYSGKTMFPARALTDMFPLTAVESMAIDGGATGVSPGANTRYAFKGRIIGENSPHSFLPNPCDPSYDGDQNQTYRIIAMHTTFLTTNIIETEGVTRGDIVLVELDKTDHTYNLEYGRFLSITAAEKPAQVADQQCFSLKDLAGGWESPAARVVRNTAAVQAITSPGGAMAAARTCKYTVLEGGVKVQKTEEIPSYFRFNNALGTALLDSSVKARFDRFLERAKAAGFKVSIGSVRRSPKHQWTLYTYKCLGGMKPAAPCNSEHQYGFAMDVTFTKQDGTVCKYGNNCIPNELQPIASAADINLTGYGSDADPVHWGAKTPEDVAKYQSQKAKCRAHFYKNYAYTADAGATSKLSKNWPPDFKDNVSVIGYTGQADMAATPKTPTYDEKDQNFNWWWVDIDGNKVATKADAGQGDAWGYKAKHGGKWWYDAPKKKFFDNG